MSQDEIEQLAKVCKQMLQDGREIEEVLGFLRKESTGKVFSAAVLIQALGISAAEAKSLIHKSATWKDRRERDEEIHEAFYNELDKN